MASRIFFSICLLFASTLLSTPRAWSEEHGSSKTRRAELAKQYADRRSEISQVSFLLDMRRRFPKVKEATIAKTYGIRLQPHQIGLDLGRLEEEIERLVRELGQIEDSIGSEGYTIGPGNVRFISQGAPPPVDHDGDGVPDTTTPVETDEAIVTLAQSVAAIVRKSSLEEKAGAYILHSKPLRQTDEGALCSLHDFHDKPAAAVEGTAFLIDPKTMITAAHVLGDTSDFLADYVFVFGYMMVNGLPDTVFTFEDWYEGSHIVGIDRDPYRDWCAIALSREVSGRVPLTLAQTVAAPSDSVFVIGHPFGMPAMMTGPGAPEDTGSCFHFRAKSLNGYRYNSGSPAFNLATHRVEGAMLRNTPQDKYSCPCPDCGVTARCDAPGLFTNPDFPGTRIVRTWLFAEFLAHRATVRIRNRVDAGASIIVGGERIDFSVNDEGYFPPGVITLVAADCSVDYTCGAGEVWTIVPRSDWPSVGLSPCP
jgi:hypothetical protein